MRIVVEVSQIVKGHVHVSLCHIAIFMRPAVASASPIHALPIQCVLNPFEDHCHISVTGSFEVPLLSGPVVLKGLKIVVMHIHTCTST